MKLWILHRLKDTAGYDICWGLVVRASSASAARKCADAYIPNDGEKNFWLNPKNSSCEPLTYSGPAGVIMEDFLAG